MQCKNGQMVDGWVFGNASGILSTALGISLTDSLKNHSGLRLWGKLEEEKGQFNIHLIEKMWKKLLSEII